MSCSSGLGRRVVMWLDTSVSERHIASTCMVKNSEDGGNRIFLREDGGSMTLRNDGIVPHHYTVS